MRLIPALGALLFASAAFAAPPGAKITVSDKLARPATINVYYAEAAPLVAAEIRPEQLAAEFKQLCLDTGLDAGRLSAAAPRSALGLRQVTIRNIATRGVPAFEVDGWYGAAASVRIWTTDPQSVRKLPWEVVDSGVIVTGPQKPPTPQCNLDIASTALADWDATLAALNAAIGTMGKAKRSKKWAQAEWRSIVAGSPVLIGVRVDDLHRPSQMLHIGVVPSSKPE